jgi:hypothetical protein
VRTHTIAWPITARTSPSRSNAAEGAQLAVPYRIGLTEITASVDAAKHMALVGKCDGIWTQQADED